MRAGLDTSTTVSKYTYDSKGRVLVATDPKGHTTTYAYLTNGLQNTDSVFAIGRKPTRFFYDLAGRVRATVDPRLVRDTASYDVMNRVLVSIRAQSKIQRTYDALFLKTVTANSQLTQYSYNALGWLTTETDPAGRNQLYDYDKNGNLVTWTNRRGGVVTSAYNNVNELTARTLGDNLDVTYFSDPQGRFFVGANAAIGSDTIRFNIAGLPDTVVSVVLGRDPYLYTRVYKQTATYDKEGRRLAHQLNYSTVGTPPAGAMTFWANGTRDSLKFDAKNRLTHLVDASQFGSTFLDYDEEGAPKSIGAPGLVMSLGSSGAHLPSIMKYNIPALDREFAYDAKTGLLSDRITSPGSNGKGIRFSYDTLGQLRTTRPYTVPDPTDVCGKPDPNTGAQNGACPLTFQAINNTFTYDSVGNRTDKPFSLLPGNRMTSFNNIALLYDFDGNLIRKTFADGTYRTFNWSADNRLLYTLSYTASGVNTSNVSFRYDAFGRRMRKYAAQKTRYLYDGENVIAQLTDAGEVQARYTYYPGVDRPHSVMTSTANGPYYVATEQNGNITGLTNKNSTLLASWDYDSWGVPATLTGADSIPMTMRFAGREYDAETGLYYNRARYYDPQIGRFISEDPIGIAGGMNPYTYAGNSPTNATDPSGLTVKCSYTRTRYFIIETGETIGYGDWRLTSCTDDDEPGRGGGGGGGSNSTKTLTKVACSVDVAVDLALGFAPGYNVVKMGLDAAGFNLHIFENMANGTRPLSYEPGSLTTWEGVSDAGRLIAGAAYATAGGDVGLARAANLRSRTGFASKSAAQQAKLVGNLGRLSRLAKVVALTGGVAQVLNIASSGADWAQCLSK